jgi:hypothetical protein
MGRTKIKIINESIEKTPPSSPKSLDEPLNEPLPEVEVVKIPKEKKPRTEKQILAFQKALETKKAKAEAKKSLSLDVPLENKIEIPKEVEMKDLKKRGRPKLTEEKIEMKASMKELALQKQLDKLQKKIEMSAKQEAKKQVLEKIKSKLNNDDESVSSMSDDEEINQIVKKQKKPIVIVNKIDGRSNKKQLPPQQAPTAYFI